VIIYYYGQNLSLSIPLAKRRIEYGYHYHTVLVNLQLEQTCNNFNQERPIGLFIDEFIGIISVTFNNNFVNYNSRNNKISGGNQLWVEKS